MLRHSPNGNVQRCAGAPHPTPKGSLNGTVISEPFPQRMRTPVAALYTGLSPRTLEKLRLTGGGPAFLKIGRTVIYERDDLDAWLNKHRRQSTSDPGMTFTR